MRVGALAPAVQLARFADAGEAHAALKAQRDIGSTSSSASSGSSGGGVFSPGSSTSSNSSGAGAMMTSPPAIDPSLYVSAGLWEAAQVCDGFSGRSLRKLPLQAQATHARTTAANSTSIFAAPAAAAAQGSSSSSSSSGSNSKRGRGGGGGTGVACPPDTFVRALIATIRSEQAARAGFAVG